MASTQVLEAKNNNNRFEVSSVLKTIKSAFLPLSDNQLELALSWSAFVESHDIVKKSDFTILCADFLIDCAQFEVSCYLDEDELYEIYDIIFRKGLDLYC